MRIPNVEGLKDAHGVLNTSDTTIVEDTQPEDATNGIAETHHRHRAHPKSFGRAAAVLNSANGTSRSSSAESQDNGQQLNERQTSCAKGKAFYKCQNGFTGCCSVNPCNPRGSCPDDQKASDEDAQTKGQGGDGTATSAGTATAASVTDSDKAIKTETVTRTRMADTATGIRTATATGTLASTRSGALRPTSTAAPKCPRGNGRTFSDSFKIPYRVRCNSDNTAKSFETVAVGTGGYDQCFSACSQSERCAGFTFVGSDTGNCFLKAVMSNSTYEAKKGKNYTSCAKLDPKQYAGTDPAGMKEPVGKSKAPIIGGVVGGVAFLALLLLVIALCAKRRRKKLEIKRRGTVTHVFHGPTDTDMTPPANQAQHLQQEQMPGYGYQQPGQGYAAGHGYGYGYQQGHQRQGSTSHDVYAQYGGSNGGAYGPRTHARQRSIYSSNPGQQQTWV